MNEFKNDAQKFNIPFRTIKNPPNTRWSGYYENLCSVLYLMKPLQHLAVTSENWSEYILNAED